MDEFEEKQKDNTLQVQREQRKEGLTVLTCLKLNGVYMFKYKL